MLPAPIAAVDPAQSAIFAGRLHPLTLALLVYNAIRNLLIPGVVFMVTGQQWFLGILLLGFLGLNVFSGLVRYFTFRYRLENGELITRGGLIERQESHIPLGRIQDLRLEQGLLHRILNVVDVHVDTAGGSGPEATLSVLSRAEAEALRSEVFARASRQAPGAAAVPHDTGETLLQLSGRDLFLEGLTANRGASVLIVLAASWQFLDDLLPAAWFDKLGSLLSRNAESWFVPGGATNWAGLAIVAFLILCASAVFSVVGAFLVFHGFRLERRGEGLSRSHGLLSRRTSSLTRRRIQVLEIEESWLRRCFGLATVRVDTAGSSGGDNNEDRRAGRDVLVPIVRRPLLDQLLPVLLPAVDAIPDAWMRVHRCAVKRSVTVGSVLCLLGAGVGFGFSRLPWTLWPLAAVPLIVLVSVQAWRHGGYQRLERCFATRRGWLNRSTRIVPLANIQVVVVRDTPLDRRHGVCGLLVDTAGRAYTGGGPHLRNLPRADAFDLARDLARAASATRYRT